MYKQQKWSKIVKMLSELKCTFTLYGRPIIWKYTFNSVHPLFCEHSFLNVKLNIGQTAKQYSITKFLIYYVKINILFEFSCKKLMIYIGRLNVNKMSRKNILKRLITTELAHYIYSTWIT